MKNKQAQRRSKDKGVSYQVVREKYYNMTDNISKPIKIIHAELGKEYKIVGPFYKNVLFFRCTRAGDIMLKYKKGPGHDILLFKGIGRLKIDEKKMEAKGCQKK